MLDTLDVDILRFDAIDLVKLKGFLLRAQELSVLPDNMTTLLYNPVKYIK